MPSSNPVRARFGSWSKGLLAAGMKPKEPTISERCARARSAAKKGKQSSNWKGGRIVDKRTGYIHLWKPGHPNAGIGRGKQYVLEHRFVLSEHLGRPLLPNESVHHKNGKRDDNSIENLELWVSTQPSGQRAEDLVKWAKEILNIYENPELLKS